MKTIFKAALLAMALLAGMTINAQDKPLTFGVKAGMNLSNFGGDTDGTKAKIGFNVGVTVDYAFSPELYLLSGLEFTTKGSKTKEFEGEKATLNAMYLQLPVHLGYKLKVAEATKIVFHAGPYIAYGVGGKVTYEYDGQKDKGDFFGDEEEGGCKRFDFGLGLGVGAEFGKINVGLGYDFGLLNITREDDFTMRNMNGYLTVGYKF